MALAYSIDEVMKELGISKTKLYEEIGAGKLTAKKLGRRTIITHESLSAYIASLPAFIPTGAQQ